MTNTEKYRIESYNSHSIGEGKVKKGIGAVDGLMASHGQGVTFADSLYSITAQNVDAWTSEDEQKAQKEAVVDRICKTTIQKLLYYARERWSDNDFSGSDRSGEDNATEDSSVNVDALSAVYENLNNGTLSPETFLKIKDATEKLKEDFGIEIT